MVKTPALNFLDAKFAAGHSTDMSVEVIGIDHIYIAVSDLQRSEKYYNRIMPLLRIITPFSSATRMGFVWK